MENITGAQHDLLEELGLQRKGITVRWNEERGVASLLEGPLLSWDEIREPEGIMRAVLARYGALLGPVDVIERHQVTEIRRDRRGGGYRARGYQVFDNLPIYGATLLVFADEERGAYRVQSSFWRDVKVTAEIRLDENELRRRLDERLRRELDAAAFEAVWREQRPDAWALEHYPLTAYPTLYLYPMAGGFHPAYDALAYQPIEWYGVDGQLRREIGQAQLLFDAATGEVLWLESSREGMGYTDQTGDGLSTLQDSNGNYLSRTLHVVRKDNADYYLLNRLPTPEIRTYDANGTETGLTTKLKGDTDLSKDSDSHWTITTTSCTATTRRDSQQPEVDGHFNAEEALAFYQNLGWDGFDDGAYGTHCPVRVVAHIGMDANAYFDKYAETVPGTTTNKYYGYIAFYDGQCDGNTLKFDFIAGDPIIFGHEYQHAITFFGAAKSNGGPGHLYGNDWLGAIREGYSDSIACLRQGLWINPPFYPDGATHRAASGTTGAYQITVKGNLVTVYPRPFRRVEFPRSTDTYDGSSYCDHYDDRDSTKSKYFHSTLLSHLAFLVGQGGVHQRAGRVAEFIPITGVGLQRTAEIFMYALTQYFDTIPTDKGAETLVEAARLLLDAAKNVHGSSNRKCEYVMMRRALYAVGLYPYDESHKTKQTYGGEACMLPWTYSWRFSQPYLGFPALWWQSPDLFINNNGSAEYDAIVGQENSVFARVRNIGDQDLQNVRVRFLFLPHGTNLPPSSAQWKPCQDSSGNDCVLDIPVLAAGSMNFTDVNNPPTDQGVSWYLDPAEVIQGVDHFCLRAVIECNAPNHDHDCDNYVQSNVRHVEADAGDALRIAFFAGNWRDELIPLDLRVEHTLPEGAVIEYEGGSPIEEIMLDYGQTQRMEWHVRLPEDMFRPMRPPFDGQVTGRVTGELSGRFFGQLTEVQARRRVTRRTPFVEVEGRVFGRLGELASLHGHFSGELDLETGKISGRIDALVNTRRRQAEVELELDGVLVPLRAIHFTQFVKDEPIGGITVHLRPQ